MAEISRRRSPSDRPRRKSDLFLGILALSLCASFAAAQDNYEIQVYGAETVAKGKTMVELHSNFAFEGEKDSVNGLRPTNHALRETLELTQGWTPWFETGFYVFTSARSGDGWQWVGDHVRPRVRVPESWKWPVGVSLSTEFGYQRRRYSEDAWTWEIRPIADKQWGPWYLSLNPALEKSVHGASAGRGFEFSPAFKASYDATPAMALGFEYYGALGPLARFDPSRDQQHQLAPTLDLNLSPDWEFNLAAVFGLTPATDRFLVKLILGRRFSF